MALPAYITKVLDRIADQLHFVDYELKTKSGSNHGDNFLGIMIAVALTGRREKNGKQFDDTVYLICKTPPMNQQRRKNFKTDMVFDRELYMYATVLPTFAKFQREKGLDESESFLSFPQIYACEADPEHDSYILIMEDLRAKRFDMWPKDKPIPVDHELMLMRELGKFHGISFAMKDQRPDQFAAFKKLTDTFGPIARGKLKLFMDKTLQRCGDALKNPKHKQYVRNFNFLQSLDAIFDYDACDKFGVITHGDCWNNNFMFQYSDENALDLKSICMVDWQISRYCSPALDLIYNIFGATDKKFRDQHYEELLEAYYASLSGIVRRLGSNPDKLFTFNDLKDELRKFGQLAIYCAPMIIQIRVANAKDIRDIDAYSEAIENGEDADLLNEFDESTQAIFSKLVNDFVTDLFDYGYIKSN